MQNIFDISKVLEIEMKSLFIMYLFQMKQYPFRHPP